MHGLERLADVVELELRRRVEDLRRDVVGVVVDDVQDGFTGGVDEVGDAHHVDGLVVEDEASDLDRWCHCLEIHNRSRMDPKEVDMQGSTTMIYANDETTTSFTLGSLESNPSNPVP